MLQVIPNYRDFEVDEKNSFSFLARGQLRRRKLKCGFTLEYLQWLWASVKGSVD